MDSPESRFIQGPAGRLDSRWHGPKGGPPVLVLHPHPLYGGTMGSRLVYDLAATLAAEGCRVVRFDFRGVNRSDGAYAEGRGETDDAVAAFDALADEAGAAPAVVGYSFGAAVAVRLAALRRPRCTVLVALPADVVDSALKPAQDAPHAGRVTMVASDDDPFAPLAASQAVAGAFRPPARLHVVPAAGHFLDAAAAKQAIALAVNALRA